MKCQIIHKISDEMGTKFMSNWNFKSKKLAMQTLKEDYEFARKFKEYNEVKFTGERLEYINAEEKNELYIREVN
jgi:hypothetical protein